MGTVKIFEIDGKWFEVRSIDAPKEQEAPKVSLSDVFVANDSRWFDGAENEPVRCVHSNVGKIDHLSHLPTERDAKRIQAYIALINCAKYFNGVDGYNRDKHYNIESDGVSKLFDSNWGSANEVRFATEQGATETVRILKEAGLYEYLFLETK